MLAVEIGPQDQSLNLSHHLLVYQLTDDCIFYICIILISLYTFLLQKRVKKSSTSEILKTIFVKLIKNLIFQQKLHILSIFFLRCIK